MGTAFRCAWLNQVLWNSIEGWIGLDQYGEDNAVGQAFLDEYKQEYGYRPEYCALLGNRDIAPLFLRAFADSHLLSPRGVKEALERVKMVPAAPGAPGTRLSFGKWIRRGWVGSGYLVASRLDPDGISSHLVERFGSDCSERGGSARSPPFTVPSQVRPAGPSVPSPDRAARKSPWSRPRCASGL